MFLAAFFCRVKTEKGKGKDLNFEEFFFLRNVFFFSKQCFWETNSLVSKHQKFNYCQLKHYKME